MRLALGVEYFGRAHCGWQSQPSGCGVQDKLEIAVSQLAGEKTTVVAAGRTDSGVHACGQVAHFDTQAERPLIAWVRGVNAHLPETIRVRWAQPVPDDFHARFSATSRSYRYVLYDQSVRPALAAGRVGWFHERLDEEKMRLAAESLLGEHDFTSFRAAECQAKSPVKVMRRTNVFRQGDYVVFEFTANAFLQHMVRNLVGCLVYIGAGRQPVEWLPQLISARNRALAAPTFAPDGLYLSGVCYDARFGLPDESSNPFIFL
ncbi:MAG TPA: tRNA pseudouridine(38-40) synthase TruA [Burkholderiales bacterium]|nr:tRNA pseudouridine(38-40) synthase TruA [Burkholderiales bacterium]